MLRSFRSLMAIVIVFGLVIGVGIGVVQRNGQGGMAVAAQSASGSTSNGTARNGSAQARANGGSMASGTIQSVEGQNLTLTTANGTSKVNLADGVKIYKSSTIAIDQLKVGDQVAITGRAGSDGKTTATTIEFGAVISQPGGQSGPPSGGAANQAPAANGTPVAPASGPNNGNANGNNNMTQGTPNVGSASGGQPTGAQGSQNGGVNGRQRVSGTIDAVSSSEITIKAADGTSSTFTLGSSTVVNRVDEGTKDDLKAGVTVSATGTAGTDGVLSVSIIRIGQTASAQSGGPAQ